MPEPDTAKEWGAASKLELALRSTLPDEYAIVSEAIVGGLTLDGLVVGRQGLFVLDACDWKGMIVPTSSGLWQEQSSWGQLLTHPNPAIKAQAATKALEAFLKDEFADLHPQIHHLVVLTDPNASIVQGMSSDPLCIRLDDLATHITAQALPEQGSLDHDTVKALAMGLEQRQLTRRQRAGAPFIFRSSGITGIGKKAWTVQHVIRHMDRYPDDGIYHLQNGSVERWFAEQGALHLAALARETASRGGHDPRVTLETFLWRTGMVSRPRLAIRPRRLNVGYVLQGDEVARRLRLRKGWGRGYLFGTLASKDSWIHVQPDTFAGELESVVHIDTEPLSITERPIQGRISVKSGASEVPRDIVVSVHVKPMPSWLNRFVARPLVGAVMATILGAAVGSTLGASLISPGWLSRIMQRPMSSGVAWGLLVALCWAPLGAVRGFYQRPAWPTIYALRRWLLSAFRWACLLALLVAGLFSFALWLYPQLGHPLAPMGMTLAALTLATAALALSTVREVRTARREGVAEPAQKPWIQRHYRLVLPMVLIFSLLAIGRLVLPIMPQLRVGSIESGTIWSQASHRWEQWEGDANAWLDKLYIRRHDRRAPTRPPVIPTPEQGSIQQANDQ